MAGAEKLGRARRAHRNGQYISEAAMPPLGLETLGPRERRYRAERGAYTTKHGTGRQRKRKRVALMTERHELYCSPNGDSWFLAREPENGHAFIIHQPNAPSGGRTSHIELGEFLRRVQGPEQRALLRLIGSFASDKEDKLPAEQAEFGARERHTI
jgi:hypothetical protein